MSGEWRGPVSQGRWCLVALGLPHCLIGALWVGWIGIVRFGQHAAVLPSSPVVVVGRAVVVGPRVIIVAES